MYQESEMNKFMSLNIRLLRIVTQRSFNQFIKRELRFLWQNF